MKKFEHPLREKLLNESFVSIKGKKWMITVHKQDHEYCYVSFKPAKSDDLDLIDDQKIADDILNKLKKEGFDVMQVRDKDELDDYGGILFDLDIRDSFTGIINKIRF